MGCTNPTAKQKDTSMLGANTSIENPHLTSSVIVGAHVLNKSASALAAQNENRLGIIQVIEIRQDVLEQLTDCFEGQTKDTLQPEPDTPETQSLLNKESTTKTRRVSSIRRPLMSGPEFKYELESQGGGGTFIGEMAFCCRLGHRLIMQRPQTSVKVLLQLFKYAVLTVHFQKQKLDTPMRPHWFNRTLKVIRQLVTKCHEVTERNASTIRLQNFKFQAVICGCILAILRFASGISWGYTPLSDNRFLSEQILKTLLQVSNILGYFRRQFGSTSYSIPRRWGYFSNCKTQTHSLVLISSNDLDLALNRLQIQDEFPPFKMLKAALSQPQMVSESEENIRNADQHEQTSPGSLVDFKSSLVSLLENVDSFDIERDYNRFMVPDADNPITETNSGVVDHSSFPPERPISTDLESRSAAVSNIMTLELHQGGLHSSNALMLRSQEGLILDESAGSSLSFQKIKDRTARIPDYFKATSKSNFILVKCGLTQTQNLLVDGLASVLTNDNEYKCKSSKHGHPKFMVGATIHCNGGGPADITSSPGHLVRFIIQSMIKRVSQLRYYLLLTGFDVEEKLKIRSRDKLRPEPWEILKKFWKVLKYLRLDFNVCILFSHAENLLQSEKLGQCDWTLKNFAMILRAQRKHIPSFMKFVFVVDQNLWTSKSGGEELVGRSARLFQIFKPCPVLSCGVSEVTEIPPQIQSVLVDNILLSEQKHSAEAIDAKHKIIEFISKNAKTVHPFDLSYFLYETLRTQTSQLPESLAKVASFNSIKEYLASELRILGGVPLEVQEAVNVLNVCTKAIPFSLLLEMMPSQTPQGQNRPLVIEDEKLIKLFKILSDSPLYKFLRMGFKHDWKVNFNRRRDFAALKDFLKVLQIELDPLCKYLFSNGNVVDMNYKPSAPLSNSNVEEVKLSKEENLLQMAVSILKLEGKTGNNMIVKSSYRLLKQVDYIHFPNYLKYFFFHHLARSKYYLETDNLHLFLNIHWMYGQTRYHRSYTALYNDINSLLVTFIDPKAKQALTLLKGVLYRMEETLIQQPVDFSDFVTQLRIRIGKVTNRTNDQTFECILPSLFKQTSAATAGGNIPIFRTIHHHLLENSSIHTIMKGCEQITCSVISKSNGLYYAGFESGIIIEASLKTHEIQRVLVSKNYAPCTLSLANQGEILITAGFGPVLQIWNLNQLPCFYSTRQNEVYPLGNTRDSSILESGVIQKIPPNDILQELKDEEQAMRIDDGQNKPMKTQQNPLTLKSVHSIPNLDPSESPTLQQDETTAGTSQLVGIDLESIRLPGVGSLNIPEILITHAVSVHHSLYVAAGNNMKIYEYTLNSWATAQSMKKGRKRFLESSKKVDKCVNDFNAEDLLTSMERSIEVEADIVEMQACPIIAGGDNSRPDPRRMNGPHRLFVILRNYTLKIFNLDLTLFYKFDLNMDLPVSVDIRSVTGEVLVLTRDGQVCTFDVLKLKRNRELSFFNVRGGNMVRLLAFHEAGDIMGVFEERNAKFYKVAVSPPPPGNSQQSANTVKLVEAWEHPFNSRIIQVTRSPDQSVVLIGDKSGNLIINRLTSWELIDQSRETRSAFHKRNDGVLHLQISKGLNLGVPEGQPSLVNQGGTDSELIYSCSQQRDLRIWKRDSGEFYKKYNLTSFTAELITCMSLCSNQYHIYLGSKDMNIYLIDIDRGKLLVVFEGHWNRVTNIYKALSPSILFTASQSSCKVWHLEKDDCLRTFSQHLSSIVSFKQHRTADPAITSIGANGDALNWNYENGQIEGRGKFRLRGLQLSAYQTGQRDLPSTLIFSQPGSNQDSIEPSSGNIHVGRNIELQDLKPTTLEFEDDKGEDEGDQNDEIISIEHLDYFNQNYVVLSTNKNLISIYTFSKRAMDVIQNRTQRYDPVGTTTIGSNTAAISHNTNNPNNTTAQPQSVSMLSDCGPFRGGIEDSKESGTFKSFKNQGSKQKRDSKKPGAISHFDALCTVRSFKDEHIVNLRAITTSNYKRMMFLVTTKTSCILYEFLSHANQVRRLCAYILNSRQRKQELFEHVKQSGPVVPTSRNVQTGLFALREQISVASLYRPSSEMTNHPMQSFSHLPDAEHFPLELEESKIQANRSVTSRKGNRPEFIEPRQEEGMPGNVIVTNIHEGPENEGLSGVRDRIPRVENHEHQPLGIKMQFSLPYNYYFTSCRAEVLYGSLGKASAHKTSTSVSSESMYNEESLPQTFRDKNQTEGIEGVDKKKIQGASEFQRDKEYLYVVLGDSRGFLHICNIFGIDGENFQKRKEDKIYLQSAR